MSYTFLVSLMSFLAATPALISLHLSPTVQRGYALGRLTLPALLESTTSALSLGLDLASSSLHCLTA